MPRVLRSHQHELTDLDGAGDGLLFGTEDTGYLTLTRPVVVNGDARLNDTERAREDGRVFGRDYSSGKSFNFEIGVLTDGVNGLGGLNPEATNLDYLDALGAVWEDEKWRDDPNAMAMLRSCEAGRTSRCYGRPRRYDEAAGTMTQYGYTPVVASFDLIDGRWYADEEQDIVVTAAAPSVGGFSGPLVAPITTTLTTSGGGVLVIGGAVSTWPVVEFYGPCSDPSLTIGDLTIGLFGVTLDYDHVITVDPRPWVREVTRNIDGAGMAGYLSADTPVMPKMLLPPGTHSLIYSARNDYGTSQARLRWRTARKRP